MSDLAASIETLAAAYDQAEAAWRATPANTLHWDWLVEQKCRLADVTRGNLPAILAALRASRPEPAAYAVERHLHAALSDLEREERAHGETIDQRDAAESALSEAYLIVTGQPPEWSNRFGYREALDDIRAALPRPEADEGAVRKADEIFDDITRGGPTVDAVMREDWATVAEWMRQRAEDGLAVTRAALAAAQEGAVERATLAAYDAFFEGQIGCCEPSWDELPDSHKDRMRRSIRAALAAAQEGQR